jgi:hypothetical protein
MQPRYQFQVVDISSANVDGTRGVESRKKEKVGLLGKPVVDIENQAMKKESRD